MCLDLWLVGSSEAGRNVEPKVRRLENGELHCSMRKVTCLLLMKERACVRCLWAIWSVEDRPGESYW
jgi:hypothetical protein